MKITFLTLTALVCATSARSSTSLKNLLQTQTSTDLDQADAGIVFTSYDSPGSVGVVSVVPECECVLPGNTGAGLPGLQ